MKKVLLKTRSYWPQTFEQSCK